MAINFNTSPYYDDYDSTNDFYRVLFRPGYAVQTRELTQLQTMLQEQTKRFGDHIFKNGSMVIPGSINVDNQVHFAKLESTYGSTEVTTYLTSFSKMIVTGETSGVKARVIDTSECTCVTTQKDIATLYYKIETPGTGDAKRFLPGENIIAYAADNTTTANYQLTESLTEDLYVTVRSFGDNGEVPTTYSNDPVTDVLGFAYGTDVKAGIYYIDGVFVRNDEMHLYVGRFDTLPTCRVGFKVVESIVTPEDDESLLDNALISSNYTAPGAHRYKISLELVKLDLTGADDIKFIELLRIVDGRVQHILDKASYAELEKTLARRTHDESGNYEVNKFKLSTREHLDNGSNFGLYDEEPVTPVAGVTYGDIDKFIVTVDPGKAYVSGYEIEATVATHLALDKARENSITGDEGNHIVRLDDQPVGTPVGNYVLVTNMYDLPDLSTFEQVYLVKTLNGTPGAAPSTSDIVGTARVRAIQLHSSDYTDGNDTQFKLSLFDIQMYTGFTFESSVKQLCGVTTTTFTCDLVPDLTHVTIAGSASASNSSTTVTGVGTRFPDYFTAGDVVYINGTYIGVVATTPTDNLALTLTANAAVTVSGGDVAVMHAKIYEPNYNNLLYKLGYQSIKTLRGWDGTADTLKSSTMTVRRVFTATASGAGVLEAQLTATGETFLSDSDLNNYTLFYTDNSTGTNRVVDISSSDITFDSDTVRKVVYIAGLTASKSYTLIASVYQVNLSAAEKTKTLVSNFSDDITGRKNVTGSKIELTKADIYQIVDVRVTPGDYNAYNSSNYISIKDSFTLDDGQRTDHYTNGKLVLKPGALVPSGAVRVIYDYFNHTGTGNYFSVDSYTGQIDYENIPSYRVTDAMNNTEVISLTDVLDFRPVIAGTNTFYNEIPKIGTDFGTSFAYYLSRIDKIVLDSVGRFNVIKGVPALDPKEPSDPKEGMVLASVIVPAYTKKVSDVKLIQRDNRRYTMRDIGNLERRISSLEYYVSLNLLEQNTATLQIKDTTTGLDRFKNGFIVDQFTGHGIGDVLNVDYKCGVDPENRELRPMHYTTALDMVEDITTGSARTGTYAKNGDIITLPYTSSVYIFNNTATRTIDVNPYKIGAFKGEITLNPEGDNWQDTDRRPDLLVQDDNNYDAIKYLADKLGVTGTKWNAWQTNWTGVPQSTVSTWVTGNPARRRQTVTAYQQTVTTQTGERTRTGIQTSLTSTVNSTDYGDRVVDISFAPYMRARPVMFTAKNLKASTRFYAFFDDKPVGDYIRPADIFRVELNTGATLMNFEPSSLQNNLMADDPTRAVNGEIQAAYNTGDVIQNSEHTAVNITAISNITSPSGASSFTVTVEDSTDILPGHHVFLYNLGYNREVADVNSLFDNINVAASTISNPAYNTSSELNLKVFKVTGVSSTTLTLAALDDSTIDAFSSYSTSAYTAGDGGKLLRLQASGVVAFSGVVVTSDSAGNPTDQYIHVVNIKNGFGIGDTALGTVNIGSTTTKNNILITEINGNSAENTQPTFKQLGDAIRTDTWGSAIGVFEIPNSSTLSFRTGERTFKLIDNVSNSDADFDSKGSVVYYSQGVTLQKERTIVNSRTAAFVQDRLFESIPVRRTSVSTRVLYSYYTGHDPVAQTFTISSTGGAYVTGVDVYFSEAGNRPITVELRNTSNGVPSTKVIPFSQVTKNPSQVNVSDDGSEATHYEFHAPIYLQDGETYALIVKTDEPGCQLFVSELGKTDIITGNTITNQPLTGSLYLSQNSKEFIINPLMDMKFNLYRAEFNTTSQTVYFRATPPLVANLEANPFQIAKGTNKIRVNHRNHGFKTGDTVVISGVADGLYGCSSTTLGIPASLLNGPHTVIADGLHTHSYVFELDLTDADANSLLYGATTINNFVTGSYGGSGVKSTTQLDLDTVFVKTSDLTFQDASINYHVKAENAAGTQTDWLPIVANSNYDFDLRKHIKSYENQAVVTSSPLVKRSSLKFKAVLATTNKYVSPLIDMAKLSAYSITNLVDSPSASLNVAELDMTVLIDANTISNANVTAALTGTVTTSTSANTVTGVGTAFTTEIVGGSIGTVLKKTDGNIIGTVHRVVSGTVAYLTANANYSLSGVAVDGYTPPYLNFNNDGTYGVMSTNIDDADNLLVNAVVGKRIELYNAHANVNGTYTVTRVENLTDTTSYIGNDENDIAKVYLSPMFTNNASILMNATPGFQVEQYNQFVDDFAPVGTTNLANYVTRPLVLTTAATNLKITFDASIISTTDVKVYYRTWMGNPDLNKLPYIDTGFSNATSDPEYTFTEKLIDLTDLPDFTTVSIKIVMKSTSGNKVPKIKNLRVIAYS